MNDLKIAIIGGSGFVGTYLSRRLNKNNITYKVCDVVKSKVSDDTLNVDVENFNTLSILKDFNCIINLAAVHRDDIRPLSRYDDVNVNGAKNLCLAARKYNINKIIFTSSVAIYGFAPPNTGEDGQPSYFNDYGRTKFEAEKIFKKWLKEDPNNRSLIIIRPTVIFGEGNRGNVYNLLNQIASGKFVMFGNGKNKKSMAYIENVVSFIEYTLSFKPGLHIYNYIDKKDFDMNTLVSKTRKTLFKKDNVGLRMPAFLGMALGYCADFVSKVSGKKLPVSSIRVKKFMATTQFNTSVSKTGFIPPVSIEEGLTRTLKYEFLENNSDKPTFETE